MTATDVLKIVDELEMAATEMLNWLRPGHERFFTFDMRVNNAVSYARQAGHLANRLIDISEGRP